MTAADPTPDPTKKTVKTPSIPDADIDLKDTAILVNASWLINPGLTLLWLTQPNFKLLVTDYSETLMGRISIGGTRPEFTKKLKIMDAEINKSQTHIKDYLVAKYGSNSASSYFSQFGMVHKHKGYSLPADRNDRSAALAIMLEGITANGFDAMEFGLVYWTDIKTLYDTLLNQAEGIDGSVSSKVGNKNQLKKQVRKALNAIIRLLKANYPDTYKTEMRNWGFQKEKY
jgi:hypothetical protein